MNPGCAPPEAVVRARAYLVRVAEPPAPALAALVLALGPVEVAARVREGAVSEEVARETAARRSTDLVAVDLDAAHASGARLLTPEHAGWPHWAFTGFDNATFGATSAATPGTTFGASGTGRGTDPDGGGGSPATAGTVRRAPVMSGARPVRGELAPPLALWVRGPGSLDTLADRSAALVGARAATAYGLHVAAELGTGLAAAGFTAVSGAAVGVDGAAHRGALAGDGPTVAVLACGVDRSYPAAHEALLERIAATGLVVSEYPPGAVPARHRFLVRNRLIAGIAGGTVVVEAGLRSGAQRTAADARALGRPVMAVPGPVTSGRSAGSHRLIREGAVLVTRIEEVLEEVGRIGEHLAPTSSPSPTRPTDGLGAAATLVHDALPARAACGIGWLATEAGVPLDAARAALAELTRRGLVEHRGGRWQRTMAPPC